MVKRFEKSVKQGNYLIPESRLNKKGGYRYTDKWRNPYIDEKKDKLLPLMKEVSKNLTAFVYKDINDSPSGYKYLITTGGTSHTAFTTDKGFKRYLRMTGLKKKFVEETNKGFIYQLIGSYTRTTMSGNYKLLNDFGRKKGLTRTKILDNGEYTTGYYDGKGNIYLLNPNYNRTIYNYFWE